MVKGNIEDKFEKSVVIKHSKKFSSTTQSYGFFKISGKEYMVPYNDYQISDIGDAVTLHITNLDEIVFKITKN